MASDIKSSPSFLAKENTSLILEAIKLHFDSQDLKKRVKQSSPDSILHWRDEHGLDLLHQCILENNIVAFVLLLSQGYFKSPHEPETWPYLHLVACLGHKAFISTTIQDLKYQCDSVVLNWKVYFDVIKSKASKYTPELQEEHKRKSHTPIDIAALFGHMNCVHLLLDFWQVQNTNRSRFRSHSYSNSCSYLTLACKADSPFAVRLLLTESTDKKEALETAIKIGMPECVDIVLRDRGIDDVKGAFQGMNLYHVLFSYRSCRTPSQYEDLVEIVSVLVRHKQDVNAYRPSRTFPLYSLLSHHPVGCSFEQSSPCLLAILLVLVNAGANPNFDEILVEEKLHDTEQCTAFGRRPYSSAINCLLCNLPVLRGQYESESVTKPVDDFTYKCIEILLRHGADLSVSGKFNEQPSYEESLEESQHEGTALHVMASIRTQTFINYSILRLILRYGIDADVKGKWFCPGLDECIEYAVNIMPFSICDTSTSNSLHNPDLNIFSEKDMQNFKFILRFMSQGSIVDAFKEFVNISNKLKATKGNDYAQNSTILKDNVISEICEVYTENTQTPWLLQRCCSNVIWRACRMHMGNLFEMDIPQRLRTIILNFH